MTIGILKTDTVRPEWVGRFGEYPDMFEALLRQVDPTLEFQTWDVEAGELPEELGAAEGYIITGSKSSVYDDKPWIRALEDFVRHAHLARRKVVGICFGHQLIARALGGLVDKSSDGWGCGVQGSRLSRLGRFGKRPTPRTARTGARAQGQIYMIQKGCHG